MKLTLILGGVRAGKSARALELAEARAASLRRATPALFVATAQAFDEEMRIRIERHRAERGNAWQTLEEPVDVARRVRSLLDEQDHAPGVVVIDCLTLWVSNLLLAQGEQYSEPEVGERTRELLDEIERCARLHATRHGAEQEWIIVSNEVGLGIVPPSVLGRLYRDALGRANQLVAARASRVLLMVAGLELQLK